MRFREYPLTRIMVVEKTSKSSFEAALEKVFNDHDVIDIQYSTSIAESTISYSTLFYSALVLLGKPREHMKKEK